MKGITAPWTPEEVDALNRWQQAGYARFTCMNTHKGNRELVATKDGWICTNCDYMQNWAHSAMLELPTNPMDVVDQGIQITASRSKI